MSHTNIGEGINILLPFDGGESSAKALDEAITLAKKMDAHLTLIHVIEQDERSGGIFHWHRSLHKNSFAATEGTEVRDRASIQILEGNETKLEQSGIKYTMRSETASSVSKTIVDVINQENYGLVVIGCQDPVNHDIPKKIISKSQKPVIVVK
jgi:nucleotide-binding universal stress UspA family protein